MEIRKRPSNGRGEYEIAGSVSGLSTSAIVDKPLIVETQSSLGLLPTGIVLRTQGGKRRLRLATPGGIHIQRWIEALLIMPKSIREEGQLLGGQPVVIADRYVLGRADITSAQLVGSDVLVQLGSIDCINDSGTHQIDFPTRLQQIFLLYNRAGEFPENVRDALLAHQADIAANKAISKATEKLVAKIISAAEEAAKDSDSVLIHGEDPVPLLLDLLRSQPSVEIPPLEEIDPQDIEIRRRVADRWRLQKDRGPASSQFRRVVRNAYRSTCLFCGLKLPSSEKIRVPGVDAAHIVPWAHYDADVVGNGLSLCKLHHWAFDQYLLALKFDPTTGYQLVVTKIAREAFAEDAETLASLTDLAGPIAVSRLPSDPAHWPSPKLLTQLYDDVGVDL
jgi:putative restriction endonuclease